MYDNGGTRWLGAAKQEQYVSRHITVSRSSKEAGEGRKIADNVPRLREWGSFCRRSHTICPCDHDYSSPFPSQSPTQASKIVEPMRLDERGAIRGRIAVAYEYVDRYMSASHKIQGNEKRTQSYLHSPFFSSQPSPVIIRVTPCLFSLPPTPK